jgi:hypothetical protein
MYSLFGLKKSSETWPLFIEISTTPGKWAGMCMCWGFDISSNFTIVQVNFGTVPSVSYFYVFLFITKEEVARFHYFFLAQIDYTFFGQCTAILYNNWNFHVGIFPKSIWTIVETEATRGIRVITKLPNSDTTNTQTRDRSLSWIVNMSNKSMSNKSMSVPKHWPLDELYP